MRRVPPRFPRDCNKVTTLKPPVVQLDSTPMCTKVDDN